MKFDLIDERWIPVQGPGGSREVSLAELFERPDELRDLAIPFAPERMAMTRILSAMVMSAAEAPVDHSLKLGWLRDPRPHAQRVLAYVDRWRERFDLFHPERPFMQQPVGPSTSRDLSVAVLALDWASGNNVTLFDHHVDSRPPCVPPAKAVRMLLTTLLYQPGGGVSVPFNRTDSPGTKPLMGIALGRNLWQTLVGACPDQGNPAAGRAESSEQERRLGRVDGPAWERDLDREHPDRAGTVPRGSLDLMTWRSRAIQLLPSPDGAVRQVRLHQHLKLANDRPPDPYVPIRRLRGQELKELRVRPGRRLWRDADGIFHGASERGHPTVVRQALRLFAEIEPESKPQLLCVGLEVNQGKIKDSREAVLPVSEALLDDEERLGRVTAALELANGGSQAVTAAVARLNETAKSDRAKERAARWQQPFWGRLQPAFLALVDEIASAAEPLSMEGATWARWTDEVRNAAWEVMDLIWSAKAGGDDRAFEGLAKARGALQRELNRKVPRIEREVVDVQR